MIFLPPGCRVFAYSEAIDMRWAFEKLSYLIREKMGEDINYGDLYLFLGFNRKRLKCLFYDGSGLVLLTKRMEKKRFMRVEELSCFELNKEELKLLFHGSILRKHEPEKRDSVVKKRF